MVTDLSVLWVVLLKQYGILAIIVLTLLLFLLLVKQDKHIQARAKVQRGKDDGIFNTAEEFHEDPS